MFKKRVLTTVFEKNSNEKAQLKKEAVLFCLAIIIVERLNQIRKNECVQLLLTQMYDHH